MLLRRLIKALLGELASLVHGGFRETVLWVAGDWACGTAATHHFHAQSASLLAQMAGFNRKIADL
jgi:hypothetical protein